MIAGIRSVATCLLSIALVWASAALLSPSSARAAVGVRPAILSVTVTTPEGVPLPAAGERVVVSVRVRGASTCTFLRQYSGFSSLYPFKTVSCASGAASVTIPAIPNIYKAPLHLTYAVRAKDAAGGTVQRGVTLRQAAAPGSEPSPAASLSPSSSPPAVPVSPAPTATLTLFPSTVPSSGGQVAAIYSSTNATSCTLASSPTLWNGTDPATVDCSGTYTFTVPAATSQQQWTLTFTATGGGQTATATKTLIESGPTVPTSSSTSSNWAGYVVPSSALVTSASGSFTVPTLDCSATPDGGAGIWVGIGGEPWSTGGTSGVLLQTGVTADCVNGAAIYHAWWEEYPSIPNTSRDFFGLPVSPGDQIEASVYQWSDGSHWQTCVDDLTSGLSGLMVTGEGWGVTTAGCSGLFQQQGSTAGLSYSGGYTAEWIVEDYANAVSMTQVPFADFGTVTFANLGTSLSPWYLTANEAVAVAQSGTVLATPSPPSADGFSVTYTG